MPHSPPLSPLPPGRCPSLTLRHSLRRRCCCTARRLWRSGMPVSAARWPPCSLPAGLAAATFCATFFAWQCEAKHSLPHVRHAWRRHPRFSGGVSGLQAAAAASAGQPARRRAPAQGAWGFQLLESALLFACMRWPPERPHVRSWAAAFGTARAAAPCMPGCCCCMLLPSHEV